MEGIALVLAYAALPVLGNLAGGLLAERVRISPARLGLALHGAAGVILGVIALELMPAALDAGAPWVILASVAGGGLAFLLLEGLTRHVASRHLRVQGAGAAIYLGTGLDLLSDGVLIGAASTLSPGLGILVAAAQVPADVPEGFATNAAFRAQGMARRTRFLLLASLSLPILLGATLGYFVLRDASLVARMSVVAFTAGALLTLVIEEIVPEAHDEGESRLAALLFLVGFSLFFAIRNLAG